ncbi:MAG: hypothetical protein GXP28_00935 [Planctomycetes bacterium]|nr:hypothetical protein [Planctomycetota bacterium]
MRLTLRTLLAYSDDILEPADHEDLGRKIEASDFATELIHRSRDVVRRLRLSAPEVLASGGDGVLESVNVADANAVAEYLDNTLSPEDVAEFERMCLEPGSGADMHLAEVASCHHVLTMVLGEPADIDLDVRHRMYDLPEKLLSGQKLQDQELPGQKLRIEPAHVAPPQAPPQPPAAEVAAPPVARVDPAVRVGAQATEVPDYLRAATASRQRGKRWAMVATLLAVAGITGFLVTGGLKKTGLPEEVVQAELDAAVGQIDIESVEADAAVDFSIAMKDEETVVAPSSEAPSFDSKVVAPEVRVDESEAPVTGSSLTAGQPEESAVVEPLDLDLEFPEGNPDPSDLAGMPTETPEMELPTVGLPAEDAKMKTPGIAEQQPLRVASTDRTPVSNATSEKEAVPKIQGPVQLGTYLGNNDVLLRYEQSEDKWVRMLPRSEVMTGSYLLALPKFRIHVVLGDVNAYLSGGTRVGLPLGDATAGNDAAADLELALDYGRVLLNAGLKGSRVVLQVGDEVRRLQLAGSASLAVEVQRIFVPGSNNEQESSPVEATWYLTSGTVDWLVEAGEPQTREAPAMWTTVGGVDDLPQPIEELPAWIDRELMTDLQRRARNTLAEELVPGEPVGIRLLELNDPRNKGRRSEVRSLAAEASVYVGQFEPFVKALSDKDQRRSWETQIKTLRQALALSPDVAAKIHQAFIDLRGEQAAQNLMEMVAGYDKASLGKTPEAVQEGAVGTLVGRLESDSLDIRVLAIYNLNEIMGTTSLKGFRADESSQRRKIAVAKIRASLQANELVPKP